MEAKDRGMDNFSKRIQTAAEGSFLKLITKGDWIKINYDARVSLPKDFYDEVWELVDLKRVKKQLAKKIEEELADRLVNMVATELGSDIKKVLSNPERREAIRGFVRKNIDELTKGYDV